MGNITWCENCGVVTNNSTETGGYVNRVSVDKFGLTVTLCHNCEDDLENTLSEIFNSLKAIDEPV